MELGKFLKGDVHANGKAAYKEQLFSARLLLVQDFNMKVLQVFVETIS
jgi:hypothetical protein